MSAALVAAFGSAILVERTSPREGVEATPVAPAPAEEDLNQWGTDGGAPTQEEEEGS
ncbi:MAG TPA: hypothetical protein VEI97_03745 [bacterium]|nr:hypothetical protein [bacterium]